MEVEVNLHKNFNLAQRWGCVLLLDEADVFLAKRNKTDLRRNAVTSVFLRSLGNTVQVYLHRQKLTRQKNTTAESCSLRQTGWATLTLHSSPGFT